MNKKIIMIGPVYPYKGGISHYTGLMYRELMKRYNVEMVSYKMQYPKFLFHKEQKDYSNDSFKIENTNYMLHTANPLNIIKTARYIRRHIDIPKKNVVQLTDADVKKLKSIIHKKDSSQTTANRCRILLALDENHLPILSYDQCVATLNVSKARNSYSDQGIFHRRN